MNTIVFMLALCGTLILIDYWIYSISQKKYVEGNAVFLILCTTVFWTIFYHLTH